MLIHTVIIIGSFLNIVTGIPMRREWGMPFRLRNNNIIHEQNYLGANPNNIRKIETQRTNNNEFGTTFFINNDEDEEEDVSDEKSEADEESGETNNHLDKSAKITIKKEKTRRVYIDNSDIDAVPISDENEDEKNEKGKRKVNFLIDEIPLNSDQSDNKSIPYVSRAIDPELIERIGKYYYGHEKETSLTINHVIELETTENKSETKENKPEIEEINTYETDIDSEGKEDVTVENKNEDDTVGKLDISDIIKTLENFNTEKPKTEQGKIVVDKGVLLKDNNDDAGGSLSNNEQHIPVISTENIMKTEKDSHEEDPAATIHQSKDMETKIEIPIDLIAKNESKSEEKNMKSDRSMEDLLENLRDILTKDKSKEDMVENENNINELLEKLKNLSQEKKDEDEEKKTNENNNDEDLLKILKILIANENNLEETKHEKKELSADSVEELLKKLNESTPENTKKETAEEAAKASDENNIENLLKKMKDENNIIGPGMQINKITLENTVYTLRNFVSNASPDHYIAKSLQNNLKLLKDYLQSINSRKDT